METKPDFLFYERKNKRGITLRLWQKPSSRNYPSYISIKDRLTVTELEDENRGIKIEFAFSFNDILMQLESWLVVIVKKTELNSKISKVRTFLQRFEGE